MSEVMYRLRRYPRILKELAQGTTNKIHTRCGELVSFREVTPGYYAQCPECYEDLYSFEVTEQES